MSIKSYSELLRLVSFEERFRYLRLGGKVGVDTFGFNRYLNQMFYQSSEWRRCRRDIITRDNGRDLGCAGYDIFGKMLVHHINPITEEDIRNGSLKLFDSENLITTSHNTHQAITYGDEKLLIKKPVERRPNDTCPWRHD